MKVVINACFGGFGLSEIAWATYKDVGGVSTDSYDIARHDPHLVYVVESLGTGANTDYSDLQVREFEGCRYSVDEYDGAENLMTPENHDWVEVRGEMPSRKDWLHYCAGLYDAGASEEAEELTQLGMLAWDRISEADIERFWTVVNRYLPALEGVNNAQN